MTLRDTTKKIIAEFEQKSGYAVHVMEDPNLQAISTIRIARDHIPAHVLTYRHGPKKEAPDYAIIFQCVLALRLFACPPDDRMLIGSSPQGRDILKSMFARSVPDAFVDTLLQGMVTHLRSVPLGLRVSETLTLDHPELMEAEIRQMEWELQTGKDTLAESIRATMPPEIFNATQAINTAYALFWAERLERPEISNPFRLAGFERQGEALLNVLNEVPHDPLHDCELIDRWADYLQIRELYQWLPYVAP